MATYGALELTVSSPAQSFVEPIDTRQVRTWLGLPETDPDEDHDLLLQSLISAARSVAEQYQHRELAVKQWDLRLDSFPTAEIVLRHPLQSVDLVQYTDSAGDDTSLVVGTDYVVDIVRSVLAPAYGVSWPTPNFYPSGAVLVRFTSGYPPSHAFWASQGVTILQGMRLLICDWHEHRIPMGEVPVTVEWLFNMGANVSVP